jgi:ABC-type transport system involved in multi-copper enzyme maturation permease subunit
MTEQDTKIGNEHPHFALAVAAERSKLWKRPFFITLLMIILLSSVLVPLYLYHDLPEEATANLPNGFFTLARSWGIIVHLVGMFLVSLGAFSVSTETSLGTMRTMLCQPITRCRLFWAKHLVLLQSGIAIYLLAACGSFLTCWLKSGFNDVCETLFGEPYLIHTRSEMGTFFLRYLLAALVPIGCCAAMGLLFSCLILHPGVASLGGIICYLMLTGVSILSGLWKNLHQWLFVTNMWRLPEALNSLARGDTEPPAALSNLSGCLSSLLIPIGWLMLLSLTSFVIFCRRDLTS